MCVHWCLLVSHETFPIGVRLESFKLSLGILAGQQTWSWSIDNNTFLDVLFVTPVSVLRGKELLMFIKAEILASLLQPEKVTAFLHPGQGHFPCLHQPQTKARAGDS